MDFTPRRSNLTLFIAKTGVVVVSGSQTLSHTHRGSACGSGDPRLEWWVECRASIRVCNDGKFYNEKELRAQTLAYTIGHDVKDRKS